MKNFLRCDLNYPLLEPSGSFEKGGVNPEGFDVGNYPACFSFFAKSSSWLSWCSGSGIIVPSTGQTLIH